MAASRDKRAFKRHPFNAPIVFSAFNTTDCHDAQTSNHCQDGMSLKSALPLQLGKTICIRVKRFGPASPHSGQCEGLRSITLAEVKWCREIPPSNGFSYEIGVKYCAPVY
jgi:hypothetical protein